MYSVFIVTNSIPSILMILLFDMSSVFSDLTCDRGTNGIFPIRLSARLRCANWITCFEEKWINIPWEGIWWLSILRDTFLLARSQSDLTPFWNAIEWIWIILFLLRSKVSRRCRSQKIPSGTDVSEFPDKSRVFRDVANVWRSSLRSSDIWLSVDGLLNDRDLILVVIVYIYFYSYDPLNSSIISYFCIELTLMLIIVKSKWRKTHLNYLTILVLCVA